VLGSTVSRDHQERRFGVDTRHAGDGTGIRVAQLALFHRRGHLRQVLQRACDSDLLTCGAHAIPSCQFSWRFDIYNRSFSTVPMCQVPGNIHKRTTGDLGSTRPSSLATRRHWVRLISIDLLSTRIQMASTMLACGHGSSAAHTPVCEHLRRSPCAPHYYRCYTGVELQAEWLCEQCVGAQAQGSHVHTESICMACLELLTSEADLIGVRGQPAVRTRDEEFTVHWLETALPDDRGAPLDIAPIDNMHRPSWIVLFSSGSVLRVDADTGEFTPLATLALDPEPGHEPWCSQQLRHRLHVSGDGQFAAVVNDFGRQGQIIDLHTGRVTATLDGGDYHQNTVPFSFAFVQVDGRTLAIHRTEWNRLDISDPASGTLLTPRSRDGSQPRDSQHWLDYFHGALYVTPAGSAIADDGWVWHPVGVVSTWNLHRWHRENPWESEDGASRRILCTRAYYWGGALTWIDERHIALGGIGDDDEHMVAGARIFDVTRDAPRQQVGDTWRESLELIAFAGPQGEFFSDGVNLYSANDTGLSRWNWSEGTRTGHLPGFTPSHLHRGAREFARLETGALRRCHIAE